MSNTRRIVLLITILLMLAWPIRGMVDYTDWSACPATAFLSKGDSECSWDARDARSLAIKQALLITVGGIAAWVLIPGKKPDPE